jgi:glycosyltransferase involved in cell wall biosynthesis
LLQDGVNGLACAAEDSQDLARQIGRLLEDPYLRYRLASHGQETVLKQYTLELMVERVEALLNQAMAGKHGQEN